MRGLGGRFGGSWGGRGGARGLILGGMRLCCFLASIAAVMVVGVLTIALKPVLQPKELPERWIALQIPQLFWRRGFFAVL